MDDKTRAFLNFLGRGGSWQYYWSKDYAPVWFPVGKPLQHPAAWKNVYFSVNPGRAQLKGMQRGGVENVEAVNTLFSEFDIKDGITLDDIEKLNPPPSVIIASGGGWHGYWLLSSPVVITPENLAEVRKLQARWVNFTGGDEAAKDIARVLRVPGTQNHKYTPARPVEFIKCDLGQVYELDALKTILPPESPRGISIEAMPIPAIASPDAVVRYWVDYYSQRAYLGNRDALAYRMGLQLHNSDIPLTKALHAAAAAYISRIPQGTEPYTFSEAQRAIKSAYKAQKKEAIIPPSIREKPPVAIPAAPERQTTNEKPAQVDTPPETPTIVGAPEVLPMGNTPKPPEPPQIAPGVKRWSVADLYHADFPEPKAIVPGVYYEGLNILASRPKKGKSWMMTQLSGAVGTGGKFLGKDIERGSVLYLALEDGARRIKTRLQKQMIPADADITFVYTWKPLHEGGTEELMAEIERVKYRMVVVDTITRAFRGLDHTKDGARMGEFLGRLQHYAITRGIGIMGVDHTRKPNGLALNPIDDVMGSTNKSGIADVVTAIYSERGKPGATFQGTGREIEEFDLTIRFDGLTCTWQLVGETAEVETSINKRQILDILKTNGRMQSAEVVKSTGRAKANVYHELAELWTAGKIRKSEEAGGSVFYEAV